MAYLSLQQHIEYSQISELIRVLKEREKKERAERAYSIINRGISVPEDLIIEILSRLPVKTLLQFKSVSKSWHTMIVSPRFVSKHIQNYYNNNHDMDCFLVREVDISGIYVDRTRGIYDSRIDETPLCHFDIYGPCNGIYYLTASYNHNEKRLWNPTINDLKVLPPIVMKPDLPIGSTFATYEAFGFGYDPLTNDYKVVAIKGYLYDSEIYISPPRPLSILVYSLTTDSWNYWGDLPECYYVVKHNKSHIFVNGCLYWVGTGLDYEFVAIISFNIVSNVLQQIQLPNYEKQSYTSLGIREDSVAFYTVHDVEYEGVRCFNIWTFNDGFWTKKNTIPIGGDWRPVGHLKNDMVVLHHNSYLVLFDPNTNNSWNIAKNIDWYECRSIVVYMESLVSVNG